MFPDSEQEFYTAEAIEPRFLVVGDADEHPHLERLNHTLDFADDFSVVLVLPYAEPDFYAQLHHHNRLLLPILNLTGGVLPRADYSAEGFSLGVVHTALHSLKRLQQRLRELPEFPISSDRNGLVALAMSYSRETRLDAKWQPRIPEMIDYPLLTGISQPRTVLEELATHDLVSRNSFDRVHLCTTCKSSRLNVREECPECRSSNTSEETLIHHYHCAFQAEEKRFLTDRALICPKCHKELRHYGVDYDKPGTLFACADCGSTSPEPTVGFVCVDCGNHSNGDVIETRQWFNYTISPDGIAAIQNGLLPHSSLESVLEVNRAAYSRRDFYTVLKFYSSVAVRYDRPVSVWALTIKNVDTLKAKIGGRGLSKVFLLVSDVIAQSLRKCDAIAAAGETLFALLPETDPNLTDMLVDRLKQQVSAQIAVDVELDAETFGSDEIGTVLDRLAR